MLRSSKAELQDLLCRDDDNSVDYLQKNKVWDVHILVHYQSHLRTKEFLPEDISTFRFNTMARKDYFSFVNHPHAIELIRSTCDITTAPPANTGLTDNFKVAHSPAYSLKKSIMWDASLFTTFKEVKNWGTWRRNELDTARVQDLSEMLNPNHRAVTNYHVNLFKENQKLMCAVCDKTLYSDLG